MMVLFWHCQHRHLSPLPVLPLDYCCTWEAILYYMVKEEGSSTSIKYSSRLSGEFHSQWTRRRSEAFCGTPGWLCERFQFPTPVAIRSARYACGT